MTAFVFQSYYQSPIGWAEIKSSNTAIISVIIISDESPRKETETIPDVLKECKKQLSEYFAGKRKIFDLPLVQEGTLFQKEVWKALKNIPYGETISYKILAERCRRPKAFRAAGSANGKNRHWIIVPCHRVIACDGKLGGYAGGLQRKQQLLSLENKYSS